MARAELVNRYGEDSVNAGYQVYTTLDGRLQAAANRAVRLRLIEYDRRHGYRGPLSRGRTSRPAPPAAALGCCHRSPGVPQIGDLQPGNRHGNCGHAHRASMCNRCGFAQVDWDGLAWAHKRASRRLKCRSRAPSRLPISCSLGDVVYVVANDQGMAPNSREQPDAQGALVALDPDDGAIAALVGEFDYYNNKFSRVTQARRQPGSGFKPFLYSCALDHGFTPSTIVS